ncbi:phosphotransferase RcsD [Providencia rettgeri]|uniref:phosphotransferase RcsD n=1 Tax=Providencia TaxID=586 RepID=UPI00141A171A|nr:MULTISPECIES: phosphotransferase RcsD [Providencia]EJD6368500.1 phosphotransferase RcsD [Providencia rettgeri]EJD6373005.1 phosphotransferase RcsD [Providencia rettgeri]ELR5032859.1 phosphotransferase RcsD [Providencia rettgeri]ELR5129752.1 phosphotransferase RcsD [Providencia rettgeri]ELR5132020.1 phosphotransferase RcsD [Providencia rettgeri]
MYKQSSLKPSTLSRIFAAFILLLIVMLFLSLFNYYQAWVQNRQTSLSSMATRLAYQIEDYRYQASHIYKLANDKTTPTAIDKLSVTEMRHDIFWLSSANQTIDAIVFGNNKKANNVLATKLADYMEIVWGARNEYNSMYYLNGLDNTLVLVTTHSILKPELRFKESYLTLTAEEKRADMLTQSTLLDRREIISNIQKYSPDNLFYYTYRLMFNSPGQLTSVISFDISINSLIPASLNGDFFTINTRPSSTGSNESHTSWVGTNLIFSQPIEGTSYQLYYHTSLKNIIFNMVSFNLWLMTGMLIMIFLALLIMAFIRKRLISPNTNMLQELHFNEALNNALINHIAYGILVYDFNANKKILSNNIANQLLPSMDLVHIKEMAIENHDVIQVSIENIVYEIVLVESATKANTVMFIIVDKDKEALTQKRQELANREYKKNIQMRKVVFENMCSEILPALIQVDDQLTKLAKISDENNQKFVLEIESQLFYINRWFENIGLLNQLESETTPLKSEKISIVNVVNQFLKQNLSRLNNKGLALYFHNNINPDSLIETNLAYLQHLIQLIWDYSIATTSFGKISFTLSYDSEKRVVLLNIRDSGSGLSNQELNNLQSPFLGKILNSSHFTRSGMTFYLCKLLVKRMNGTFSIRTSDAIGTHYEITLPATNELLVKDYPALLEDVYVRLNIHNADISRIIRNTLANYGAEFLDLNESSPHTDWDLLITDNNEECFEHIIKINGNLSGMHELQPHYIEVNYNFADELISAISLLIENSDSEDECSRLPEPNEVESQTSLSNPDGEMENAIKSYQLVLANSGYRDLFITTVPIDINKLYNSESVEDLTELKNTAHRLKGVFAMLEFTVLHKICEDLERYIADENGLEIRKCISMLDNSVKKLMPEGNQ